MYNYNYKKIYEIECKKCKEMFIVNKVDFKEREKLKKFCIDCITWFSRWLRAVEGDCIIMKRKRSLCYTCYFKEAIKPESEWLDGSYVK